MDFDRFVTVFSLLRTRTYFSPLKVQMKSLATKMGNSSTDVKNALGLKKSSIEKYEHVEHLKIILNILKYVTPTI